MPEHSPWQGPACVLLPMGPQRYHKLPTHTRTRGQTGALLKAYHQQPRVTPATLVHMSCGGGGSCQVNSPS